MRSASDPSYGSSRVAFSVVLFSLYRVLLNFKSVGTTIFVTIFEVVHYLYHVMFAEKYGKLFNGQTIGVPSRTYHVCIGSQMVMSKIRNEFCTHFVKILILFQAFR